MSITSADISKKVTLYNNEFINKFTDTNKNLKPFR